MTAVASGNTRPSAFRARAFQFTLNRPEKFDELKVLIEALKSCDYVVACQEVAPTTGHEHVHMYAHFSQTYTLNKKILNVGAHVEICKGSPKQNIEYIKKDGNIIYERGEPPHQGYAHTVKELHDMSKDEVDPHLYRIKEDIDRKEADKQVFFDMLDEIEKDELKAPEIVYITGGTGKGKTYTAYKSALRDYKKEDIGKITCKNDFLDVINETAKCFVIEEFRSSQIKASDFLQLTDKYGYRANVKGGFITLRPERLYICSIIRPEELYTNEEINQQFLRRITKVIDLDTNDSI